MSESLNLSDLFFKIGVLTVENDALREVRDALSQTVKDLESQLEACKQTGAIAPTKRARKAPEDTK